jgi:LacI family transcriptional regulator
MTVGILSTTASAGSHFRSSRRSSGAVDQGIAVFMCNATDDPARERRHIDQLLGKRVDGLVTARRADRRIRSNQPARLAGGLRVLAGREPRCALPPAGRRGRREAAVDHLVAAGRRHIAHITGPERFEAVRLREMGWRKALALAGLKAAASDCRPGQWSEAWGREAAQALFSRRRGAPDALFCGNDQIARGVMMRCARWGFEYPMTSPWSASTIGTSWSRRRDQRSPAST